MTGIAESHGKATVRFTTSDFAEFTVGNVRVKPQPDFHPWVDVTLGVFVPGDPMAVALFEIHDGELSFLTLANSLPAKYLTDLLAVRGEILVRMFQLTVSAVSTGSQRHAS